MPLQRQNSTSQVQAYLQRYGQSNDYWAPIDSVISYLVVTSCLRDSKAAGLAKLDRNPLGGNSTSLAFPRLVYIGILSLSSTLVMADSSLKSYGKKQFIVTRNRHEEQTSSENAFNCIVILQCNFFLTSIHFDLEQQPLVFKCLSILSTFQTSC